MTTEQKQAYEWAKSQSYQSVAARYAKELCGVIDGLQSENAEKDKEIERLHDLLAERNVLLDKYEDEIPRVEAERDALLEYANAQMECEMCKNDTFCPVANPMPENCALCELKPKCPCHPCKWEWRGAQGEV